MNNSLYSANFAIIIPEVFNLNVDEDFTVFSGNMDKCTLDLKKYEFKHDKLFKGVFVINDLNFLTNTVEYFLNGKNISKTLLDIGKSYMLTENNIYFTDIFHHGIDSKCYVEDKIVLCSTWVLPFYSYIRRANNSLYANCMRHRVKMVKFLKSIQNESSSSN